MRFLVTICMLFLFAGMIASPVFGASALQPARGCAPLTPPSVPGPLAQPPEQPGAIFINEVLLYAHKTWECGSQGKPPTQISSWVELYNASDQAYDLYSAHASLDVEPSGSRYYLPLQTAIAAHGFVVFFTERYALFPPLDTATLRLLVNGITIDQVQLVHMGNDQSYARSTDAGATWQICPYPTIDASNDTMLLSPTPGSGASGSGGNGSGASSGGWNEPGQAGTPVVSTPDSGSGWSRLQMPTPPSALTPVATPLAQSIPSQKTTRGPIDSPIAVCISILSFIALFGVFWCWRRFGVP